MRFEDFRQFLVRRLDALDDASSAWQQKRDQLDQQELKAYYHFDREGFAETLRGQTQEQGMFFDGVEALLAAWARLSLLLFPIDGRDANADFRRERGKAVRKRLAVGDDSVFGDRELRDAWMHFDERLDHAIIHKAFGSRQRFVEARLAGPHVADTIRLLEVDTLVVGYRSRDGAPRRTNLRSLRNAIVTLRNSLAGQ